jgi:hypothetical protein
MPGTPSQKSLAPARSAAAEVPGTCQVWHLPGLHPESARGADQGISGQVFTFMQTKLQSGTPHG